MVDTSDVGELKTFLEHALGVDLASSSNDSQSDLHVLFEDVGGNLINLLNLVEPGTIPEELIAFSDLEDSELAIRLADDRFGVWLASSPSTIFLLAVPSFLRSYLSSFLGPIIGYSPPFFLTRRYPTNH